MAMAMANKPKVAGAETPTTLSVTGSTSNDTPPKKSVNECTCSPKSLEPFCKPTNWNEVENAPLITSIKLIYPRHSARSRIIF